MSCSLVYVTVPGIEEARAIGRALVEARLAASVNLLPGVASVYWWEGRVRDGEEALLIAKTRSDLTDEVIAAVRARHSYVCPCVVALPIEAGNPDYLDWIAAETGPR
jgi:periplasmic divalent cation tolerance protein